MNVQRIKKRLSGGGFRPFALRTSDGHEYAVQHPEMILIAPESLAVVDDEGEIVTFDALHVVALKNLRPHKNGAAKH
jgi:hypothetical protein